MNIKLFVDDLRRAPEGWVLAETVTEAIRILHDLGVEEISLDHDIVFKDSQGAFSGKNSREDFSSVARYIVAMKPENRPKLISIHTSNPIGYLKIKSILEDVGLRPFRNLEYLGEWAEGKLDHKRTD